jgi:hypothetical protein
MKTPATLTAILLATALSLPAQIPSSSSPSDTKQPRTTDQSDPSQQRSNERERDRDRPDQPFNHGITQPGATDSRQSSNQPIDTQRRAQTQQTPGAQQQQHTATSQSGSQVSTQTNVAVTTEIEPEVRTVVQQIDAQGPVVVERISTRFADAACTQENARALIEALHTGTSVTLRNEDGQTATFTPTTKLGYGEAYIAMSLAVEALRKAGITGCATPAQWQAVLLGGELSGGTTVATTTSTTTGRFPGVLVLREQGGWGKVAQTTNVQLSQIVSQANTNLELNGSQQSDLSPVGRPRDYDPLKGNNGHDKQDKSRDHQKDDDAKSPQSGEQSPDKKKPESKPNY